jgi:hypothetical protein
LIVLVLSWSGARSAHEKENDNEERERLDASHAGALP